MWATTRALIYGLAFLVVLVAMTAAGYDIVRGPTVLLAPFALAVTGALFALVGQVFTAMVKVIDDGKGISTESLIKIWEPFYTTKQDGVGLGLAICRRIVEEHGGRIEVSSQTSHGTTVTVSFPQAITDAAPST